MEQKKISKQLKYYRKHAEEINARRRERYHSSEELRKATAARKRKWRERQKAKSEVIAQ